MKVNKAHSLLIAVLVCAAMLPACKAKKPVVTRPPVSYPSDPQPVDKPTPPAPTPPAPRDTTPPPPPAKPDYNFKNIQFEFNSGILKTDSYPTLDKAAAEMKKDLSVKFVLNGNSSAEGTDAHNMELSIQRANSVKLYLVNSGVPGSNLTIKGYGETKPIADNSTEEGRVLNRRVEIKKL